MKPQPRLVAGAFAEAAADLARRGLRVIPTGGEDGKKPLVTGFTKWRKNPGSNSVSAISLKNPGANIGIVTGACSRITVVDLDDAALLPAALERFGETPLIVSTPSGGYHLYFRHFGEHCDNRRLRAEGLAIDIRGEGGLIVAPPSRNFLSGRAYSFVRGSWDDLATLPCIATGALPSTKRKASAKSAKAAKAAPVTKGERNTLLWREAMRAAHDCASEDALIAEALRINSAFTPPLDASEVRKLAASAWRTTLDGRNWFGGGVTATITETEFSALKAVGARNFADALAMLLDLRMVHREGEAFAVAVKGYGKRLGMGWRRIAAARDGLESVGLLQRVKKGGRRPGDCHLYRLANAKNYTGSKMVTYPNKTPRPLPSPLPAASEESCTANVVSLFGLRSSAGEFDE